MKQYGTGKWRFVVAAVGCTLLMGNVPVAASALSQNGRPNEQRSDAPATGQPQTPARPKTAATWSVTVSRRTPQTFTVKAKNTRLSDITAELGRLIKVPVMLSSVMEKQRVSLDFTGLNLEATLRILAPHPYVDYEVGGGLNQPKPLGIYLYALNEREPSRTEVVKGHSEAMLIEGNTEDGTGDEEAQRKREEANPLKVSFTSNQISVRARKQPLGVVLYKIASEMGIPFEMRYESPEIIDVDFTNYPVEQAIRSLSPSVRLFYRSDLQSFEIQPLRIALVAPATVKS